jgi:hypothetical protein
MLEIQNNMHTTTKFLPLFTMAMAMSVAGFVTGCKGETTYKDSPETVDKMEKFKQTIEQKQKLITDYESRIATLERTGSSGGEIVLTIENDILKVKPGAAGTTRPLDDKAAIAASGQFIDLVSRSRGAIQKCYEQALKKNSGIQAKTISLRVSASFAASGAFQSSNFAPQISDSFDACMKAIAAKWVLPAGPQSMTFQAPVTLSPS